MKSKKDPKPKDTLFNSSFEIEQPEGADQNMPGFMTNGPPEDDEPVSEKQDEPPFKTEAEILSGNPSIHTISTVDTNKAPAEKPVEISPIEDIPKDLSFDTDRFKQLADDILAITKNIAVITDDEQNELARSCGKKLTKLKSELDEARKAANAPDQERIDDRNARANAIKAGMEKEVDRLKATIAFYEQEKERKAKELAEKLERERKEKEEAEAKERLRVETIKSTIAKIKSEGIPKLEKCNTLLELNTFEANLKGWKLKTDFYAEFLSEAQSVKDELVALVAQRRPLLEEIDRKNKEAELLKGEQARLLREEADAKQRQLDAQRLVDEAERNAKALAEQNKELEARNELTVLIASFGVKDVMGYTERVLRKHGTCLQAVADREKLIEEYKEFLNEQGQPKWEIGGSSVKNRRTDYLFTIVDESLIPREYLSVDESKIKKAIQANRQVLEKDVNSFQIAGMVIYPQKSTILK